MTTPPPSIRKDHVYDAGDLGCGSGLPQEVRRRLQSIPTGDRLVVRANDPAAREDIPALARLLGHTVEDVGGGPDGATIVIRKDVKP